jgi:hypothetical protein
MNVDVGASQGKLFLLFCVQTEVEAAASKQEQKATDIQIEIGEKPWIKRTIL